MLLRAGVIDDAARDVLGSRLAEFAQTRHLNHPAAAETSDARRGHSEWPRWTVSQRFAEVATLLRGILDGASVAGRQVSDHHHVLDQAARDAESAGELPQNRVAVVEIGADDYMRVVKMARYQPAVVPPLSRAVPCGVAHTGQALGSATYISDLHSPSAIPAGFLG